MYVRYIRVTKSLLRDESGEIVFRDDYSHVIIPLLYTADDYTPTWMTLTFPVYYNNTIYYIHKSISQLEMFKTLLTSGDMITVKNKGETIYRVIGSGKIMYRAQDSDGNVIRRNYFNKNGDLTFNVSKQEMPKIEVVKSAGFENFLIAVKKNQKYQSDKFEEGIFKNYMASVNAKKRLRDILSKHPNWNEEQQCIETVVEVANKPDDNILRNSVNDLCNEILTQRIFNEKTLSEFRDVCLYLKSMSSYREDQGVLKIGTRTKDVLSRKSLLQDINFDQKASRVMSAIMSANGVERNHEVEKLFAAYADAVSIKTLRYKFILSINPTDFITMSHGNSWHSCHSFKDNGCYHSGCLSYALDNSTMIAYIIPEDSAGDYCHVPKVKRLLYMLSDDGKSIMSTKMYPNNNDNGARSTFDRTVQEMFEAVTSDSFEYDGRYYLVTHGKHYPDYNYGYRKVFSSDTEFHTFVIGSQAFAFDNPYSYTMYENICLNDASNHRVKELILVTDSVKTAFEKYSSSVVQVAG